jgi:hypothetical protein
MESALRARLLAASAITAIVGQRVYWDERPQGGVLPDITLTLVTDIRAQHLKGFDMSEAVVQVDVRATSFAGKKALKEAVIAALVPSHTGNGVVFMRATDILARPANERTETQFIYRDAIDFRLRWKA